MAIHFECSGCRRMFSVDETMAGKRASCNQCGTIVVVPRPSDLLVPIEEPLQPVAPYHAPVERGSLEPPKYSTYPGLVHTTDDHQVPPVVWISCGVGLFAIVMVITMMVISSGDSPGQVDGSKQTAETSGWIPSAARRSEPSNTSPGTPPAPRSPNLSGFTPTPRSGTNGDAPFAASDDTENSSASESSEAFEPSPSPVGNRESDGGSGSDASGGPTNWGGAGEEGVRIPYDQHRTVMTIGPLGCPVVIADKSVWHLDEGRIVQQLESEYEQRGLRALSANGEWFAATTQSRSGDSASIGIWHVPSGEARSKITTQSLELLTFSRDKYLLIGSRDSNVIDVVDAESGKQLKSIATPMRRVKEEAIAFTQDGEYFAAVDDATNRMVVMKTATQKQAAVMGAPLEMESKLQLMTPEQAKQGPAERRPDPRRSVFVYAWLRDLAFSPDSQQLAGISTNPRLRLLCWNSRGRLTFDEPLDGIPSVVHDHSLEWLPDGSGWLVSGNLIDRESKRIVMGVRKGFGEDLVLHLLDENRLLGVFPHNPAELEVMEIPWDDLRASLKLMADGAPAVLTPKRPVSLQVELGGLRGPDQLTHATLTNAMATRLARDGITIAPQQDTYFRLRFAENTGDTLPIYERQSRWDRRGHDTGRTATEAKGSLVVELIAAGYDRPLWKDTLQASSSRSFRQEITDATVRDSMLQNLARSVAELNVPYFIPESEEHMALPLVLQ